MRSSRPWFVGLLLVLVVTGCAVGYGQVGAQSPAQAQRAPVSTSYFYDQLSSDGEWFQDPNYGWCWTPFDVAADWRPYSDGNWEYTDYGWSWVSNEPFGWATYHYGRWFFDDSYGWAWVPGTEWAPAWVAWRSSDDWVGWAPLPPAARWNESGGLGFAGAGSIATDEWCFVPREHLLDVGLSLQVTSVGRNITLLAGSQDATRFEARSGRPVNLGIDITLLEKGLGRTVPRQRIVDADAPARGDGRVDGNGNAGYFRPALHTSAGIPVPAPDARRRPDPIPDTDMQRIRDEHQRKLEGDLAAEHARLVRDQESELKARPTGAENDAIRQRHVVEQQAFDAHAARQRQVMGQRMQKQVVRPARPVGNAGKPDEGRNNDKGNDKGKDKGKDSGNP